MTATAILVVEDDDSTRYLCETLLQKEGYRVAAVENGGEALASTRRGRFDLVVLDLNLPDGDGMEVAQLLHRQGVPVLIMTVRREADERLAGFEAGALDYLIKPFHPRELVFRVRNALDRCARAEPGQALATTFGAWRLDRDRRTLESDDTGRVELTRGEFELLSILLLAKGRAVARDRLLDVVSRGHGEGHPRTVDVLVSRLRRKIETDPKNPVHILTVPGVGYRLE